MKKKISLEDILKEIKQLSDDFKSRNGNAALKITNKDFNLWIVKKLLEQDGRINKLEAVQKTAIKIGVGLVPIFIFIITLMR